MGESHSELLFSGFPLYQKLYDKYCITDARLAKEHWSKVMSNLVPSSFHKSLCWRPKCFRFDQLRHSTFLWSHEEFLLSG